MFVCQSIYLYLFSSVHCQSALCVLYMGGQRSVSNRLVFHESPPPQCTVHSVFPPAGAPSALKGWVVMENWQKNLFHMVTGRNG